MFKLITDIARLTYVMDVSSIMDKDVLFESKKVVLEVRCIAVDRSSMLKIDIDITCFDAYKTSGFKFCIDTLQVKRFLKIFKPDDMVDLEYLEDENVIVITCNKKYRKFALIDISLSAIPDKIPDPPHDFICDVNSKSFLESLRVCNLSSEVIRIQNKGKTLRIDGFDDKSGCLIDDIKVDTVNGVVESLYSTERIDLVSPYFPDEITLRLHSKEDKKSYFPITILFRLRDNIGTFVYMLAPRTEVE